MATYPFSINKLVNPQSNAMSGSQVDPMEQRKLAAKRRLQGMRAPKKASKTQGY